VINSEAYQLYLKGKYHANQSTASALKKSIDYFQQAIDKDPGYALAYAALADAYGSCSKISELPRIFRLNIMGLSSGDHVGE